MKGKLKERENGHNTKELNYLKHTKRKNAMIFLPCFPNQGLWRLNLLATELSEDIVGLYDHLQQIGKPPNVKLLGTGIKQ